MTSSVKSIQWGGELIKQIEIFSSLPSTNTLGRERIRVGCAQSGTILWALNQTDGKGRRGRSWEADNCSLTFSLLWECSDESILGILPLTLGLGLVQSLESLVPDLKVKWPNDLWFGKHKLGGILGETVRYQGKLWVVLGIGLNVNISPLTHNDERISLEKITSCFWSRLGVLNLALLGVEKGLQLALKGKGELSFLFRRYGNFLDQTITVFQGEHSWSAVAKEVLPDGRLLVEDAGGKHILLPDEISLHF